MRRSSLLLALLAACGGDDAATPDANAIPDAEPGIDADPENPGTLRDTGLYSDWDTETIASDVHEFVPDPILWSDGATKRRWIYLPPDAQIDTSNMDHWQFPEGTKLWKEFTRDGTRVETRLLQKIGPLESDWFMVAFAWNEAQDEAVAVPLGQTDALDTDHDIPGRSDCRGCHQPVPSRVLGFSAIALDHDATGDEVVLATAIANGWLSDPPTATGNVDGAYFPLPGSATDQQALAYLHVNCGGCHNPINDLSQTDAEFRLEVGALATVAGTSTGTTAIDQPHNLPLDGATALIEPGAHATSAVWLRMSSTEMGVKMPPIGHSLVDMDNADLIATWIDGL